jgi:brefeldin A-inhibited guanine nucleotide-exchange protein
MLSFNKKPKEGINYAIKNGLCLDTPSDIANLLITTEGLNKERIGQLFGGEHEWNQTILKSYFELLDFKDTEIDIALRNILARIRLPLES